MERAWRRAANPIQSPAWRQVGIDPVGGQQPSCLVLLVVDGAEQRTVEMAKPQSWAHLGIALIKQQLQDVDVTPRK